MKRHIKRGLGLSTLFAILWAILAYASPTTTFHVAPVIIAAWPALNVRNRTTALPLALAGFVIAVATTALLSVAGLLDGPSLFPWGGAATEAVVGAVIGAVIGVIPALWTNEQATI